MQHNHEAELAAAEAKADYAAGRFHTGSVEDHITRITDDLLAGKPTVHARWAPAGSRSQNRRTADLPDQHQ